MNSGANGNSSTGAGGAGGANTGGGGGGMAVTVGGSGAGGSGIVILSVPNTFTASFSAGVTRTQLSVGSNLVWRVTAAGLTDTVTFTAI